MKINCRSTFPKFIILCLPIFLLGCKKEDFNPNYYDDLLLQEEVIEQTIKYDLLQFNLEGNDEKVRIKAEKDSNAFIISGMNDKVNLSFIMKDLKEGSITTGISSADSLIIETNSKVYTSKHQDASGTFTIHKIDTANKIIEGIFDLKLYSNNGEYIVLQKGIVKVTYIEKFIKSLVNSEIYWVADSINASYDSVASKYIIMGIDSTDNTTIKINFPNTLPVGIKNSFSKNGEVTASFTDGDGIHKSNVGGGLTILVMDPKSRFIRGSFEYDDEGGNSIQKGKFSVNY